MGLTPDVWITRGSSQGIYDAELESGFTHFFSPANTAWADGTLANHSSLTYADWDTWSKIDHGGPPDTVGVQAVVHLVSDGIYLFIDFTSWGGVGGGFAYLCSTPPVVPEPSPGLLLLAGLALFSLPRAMPGSKRVSEKGKRKGQGGTLFGANSSRRGNCAPLR